MVAAERPEQLTIEHVRTGHARRFASSDRIFSTATKVADVVVLVIIGGIAL
jgi:hypothetical protein